jgi:hypothetical protein
VDCPGQICCKSALTRLPKATATFSVGPRCMGTPNYSSCASYTSSTCSTVPGCTASSPSAGACIGTAQPPARPKQAAPGTFRVGAREQPIRALTTLLLLRAPDSRDARGAY